MSTQQRPHTLRAHVSSPGSLNRREASDLNTPLLDAVRQLEDDRRSSENTAHTHSSSLAALYELPAGERSQFLRPRHVSSQLRVATKLTAKGEEEFPMDVVRVVFRSSAVEQAFQLSTYRSLCVPQIWCFALLAFIHCLRVDLKAHWSPNTLFFLIVPALSFLMIILQLFVRRHLKNFDPSDPDHASPGYSAFRYVTSEWRHSLLCCALAVVAVLVDAITMTHFCGLPEGDGGYNHVLPMCRSLRSNILPAVPTIVLVLLSNSLVILCGVGIFLACGTTFVMCLVLTLGIAYGISDHYITTLTQLATVLLVNILLVVYQSVTVQTNRRKQFATLLSLASRLREKDAAVEEWKSLHHAYSSAREEAVRNQTALKVQEATLTYAAHQLANPVHALSAAVSDMILRKKETLERSPSTPPLRSRRRPSDSSMDDLMHMHTATRQMTTVLRDVIDNHLVMSGKVELRPVWCNVVQLVHQAATTVGDRTNPPREFPVLYRKGVPRVCFLDDVRLSQILLNGLQNAVQYSSEASATTPTSAGSSRFPPSPLSSPAESPRLFRPTAIASPRLQPTVVSPSRLVTARKGGVWCVVYQEDRRPWKDLPLRERQTPAYARLSNKPPMVVVEVRNTGSGLGGRTPAEIDALFQPFERGENLTGMTRAEGTGVGLPVSRMLAEQMGGSLTLFDDGLETVFQLRLPVQVHPGVEHGRASFSGHHDTSAPAAPASPFLAPRRHSERVRPTVPGSPGSFLSYVPPALRAAKRRPHGMSKLSPRAGSSAVTGGHRRSPSPVEPALAGAGASAAPPALPPARGAAQAMRIGHAASTLSLSIDTEPCAVAIPVRAARPASTSPVSSPPTLPPVPAEPKASSFESSAPWPAPRRPEPRSGGVGIEVEIPPSSGVVVPAKPAAPPSRQAAAPPRKKRSKPRFSLHVLVVDDEILNLRMLERMLKRLGCTVVTLGDGAPVVQAVMEATTRFDVVFLDIFMPGITGDVVCEQLRSRGCTLPIVAATANASSADKHRYTAAGFTSILPKPFDQAAVCNVLRLAAGAGPSSLGTPAPPPAAAASTTPS